MDTSALYRDIVLAHNREPHRFRAIDCATHAATGANPACGDELRCQLRMANQQIADLGYAGESCAITTATASMLGDLLIAADCDTVNRLRALFAAALTDASVGFDDPMLGELRALEELRRYPARHRCALLAFDTIIAALGSPLDPAVDTSR